MATSGTSLFIGDPVIVTGESNASEIDGNGPGTVPIVNLQATTNDAPISGIVVGVVPTNAQSTTYYAGDKVARLLWVCDDPDVLFEVQVDNTLTQDDVGMATSKLDTQGGSTVTGRSGAEVDATVATQGQYVIERLVPRADNELATTWPKVWVSARRHTRGLRGANVTTFGIGID